MEKEKISVIVPAYNAEKTIERCILSITRGGYSNVEIIVVNNGSTDDTERIVQKLREHDPRIQLISQENKGPAGSRETGLQNVTGEYIAWCDSDDWYEPMYLVRLCEMLRNNNADIAICRSKIPGHEQEDKTDSALFFEWDRNGAIQEFFVHNKINGCLWNKLIRKELFDGIHFDLRTWYWEDLLVIWKVLQRVNKVVRTEERLYNFYVHETSMCGKRIDEKRIQSDLIVFDRIVEDCKTQELMPFYNTALEFRANWLCSDLGKMIRDDYHDPVVEKEFQDRIKEARILSLIQNADIKRKVAYILRAYSMPTARLLEKTMRKMQ